jgi:hypothetical protein
MQLLVIFESIRYPLSAIRCNSYLYLASAALSAAIIAS